MRVKRFIVDTMPEAMQHIRNELGSDAVILSSKEIKVGGFMGIFTKKKIEVIAALDKEDKSNQDKPGTPSVQVPRNSVPQVYKKTAVSTQPAGPNRLGVPGDSEKAFDHSEQMSNRERAAVDFAAALAQAAAGGQQPAELSEQPLISAYERESAESAIPVPASADPVSQSEARNSAEQKMLDELREMKEWIARLSRQNLVNPELPESLESIREQLMRQDLTDQLSEVWLNNAMDEWVASNKTLSDEQLRASIYRQMESFLEGRFGGGIQRATRIVYIAGPTGVGKTTTIAKLAAEQLFKYQRKVGFITSDTYRISAVDQLRTYASILNVPLEVVQSPGDMQRAMHRLEDCDLILMDTAGRNYRNELLVSELQSLMAPSDHSETYLVLSLTSKSSDMVEITDHFSKFGLDKVIFTKLDETGSCGPLFNLLNAHPLKVSYMTNGQNVPDDLLMPDTTMLSRMLLGELRT
ncbi:flagellar biosynthesis protein FlhF [Paenibacillus sp. N3/727]|uniref:flagellar biosynthesis protein FlhF n=1 Tax=Paenibacillus sp. N3/727 TaxID=2925845 RepID=UPI001F537B40|nr:flagellar biosynthesis protein FlhF [Paenibacillus sp. N3/727]UNK16692.1 flagellar biosynthesis protein FlhF [Paenibacillus sp. N3/727]